MKLKKPSSTQNTSQGLLQSESIENDGYSFLFETLGNSQNYKSISGTNPIAVFKSISELETFIANNPHITELENAGFAGYISYEGDCEFAVYSDIVINNSGLPRNLSAVALAKVDDEYQIIKPDSQKYLDDIKKCQEYIKEGDIYQANLAHKFIVKESPSLRAERSNPENLGLKIYNRLCTSNPAPYTGFMDFGRYQIISSSPESSIKINKKYISSSPIKGTTDLNHLNELVISSKERAEHIMIVDLIRNDLGRICKPGSIDLAEMLGVYKFINLYHFVSTIEGELKDNCKFSEIVDACFPGGSITGAPKIRAMQIIKELESSPRGPYTGTMGYYRFKDGGEFNILIRSIVYDKLNEELSFHAGAGITAYSDPEKELAETYLKAEKLAEVFN